MDKINVNLYGGKGLFGGKETALEADIIYCDKYNECTFYKENKCLRCRSFLAPTCKFGKNSVIKGYTSRAKKYGIFKSQYTNDETYNKLHYPSNSVAVIGDMLYMCLTHTSVRERRETDEKRKEAVEGYIIQDAGFGIGTAFIPVSSVTPTLLYAIFSHKPRTIMGGEITAYKEEVVPDIVQDLKKVVPDIYNNFVSEHPEYDVVPNYVGKYAYIKTMVDGSELVDCHGDKYILKDGKLHCENMTHGIIPFHGESAKIEVTIKDDSTYKITSNEQCDENTKFE